MRLRRKPDAKIKVQQHPKVIVEPERLHGYWDSLFKEKRPLYLELGTGKGQFLAQATQQYPHINWIGVERIEEVLLQAIEKSDQEEQENLRFLWMDVQKLGDVFAKGEVDRIHLHFSDPWPKKRHAKRRLTHSTFLTLYRNILAKDGFLQLKTDNEGLFDFSLTELVENGFELITYTRDLYRHPLVTENIPTEYEEKFTAQGLPIYFLRAHPLP